jgi:branched-chain amino acid transport system substrate-binding protein
MLAASREADSKPTLLARRGHLNEPGAFLGNVQLSLIPGGDMRKATLGLIAIGALLSASAAAQETVKIGLVLPYSGQFADTAAQMDNAIKLYMQMNGDSVAGKKIQIVRRDTGGIAPDTAKRLAQELVVRENVDVLAGWILSPNALSAASISQDSKKLMVVMNAAASILTTKSPYIVRTSGTQSQLSEPFGGWAAKNGAKTLFTMVSDFAPGHDAEAALLQGYKAAGGQVLASIRFPVAQPDFSVYVQRAKDAHPDGIYVWIPAGAQPAALGKSMVEHGVNARNTMVLSDGNLTDDSALKSMGDVALGFITVAHYDWNHDSSLNKTFVRAYADISGGRHPDVLSIGGWDGMHLIYQALEKAGGKTDGDSLINVVKGMAWESPRGPITIDPETRDIIQDVYIRRVEKVDGELRNVEFDKIERVKDPVKARMAR